jgi:hypothetical protein
LLIILLMLSIACSRAIKTIESSSFYYPKFPEMDKETGAEFELYCKKSPDSCKKLILWFDKVSKFKKEYKEIEQLIESAGVDTE